MIVEIESYKIKDIYISGKSCSEKDLRQKVKNVLLIENDNFVQLFCRLYNFDVINTFSDTVDFVIDLDTHLVYKPKY